VHGEGEETTGLLIVMEGWVDLYCHGHAERQARIGLLGPGGAIGQSLRLGGGPRLVTAVAVTECAALTVSDAALMLLADRHPTVWRAVSALLYAQLRFSLQGAADLLASPPAPRVAARLLALAQLNGADLPLSQQALAEMTGLTRKTVNRVLKRLAADGAVRGGYRQIRVQDQARLALWATGP
jgi:CRP-like cAMP-binding protein